MLTNVICLQFSFLQLLMRRQFWLFCLLIMPLMSEASLQVAINELLEKAEQDVLADRLTTPVSNNAYDRYKAVLLLDQGNQRAALGLRSIAARYMDMARFSVKKRRFAKARNQLSQAVYVNGRTPQTQRLTQDIRKAEKQARLARVEASGPAPVIKKVDAEQKTFSLNPADLSQRNQSVKSHLASLGQRVQDTKEYVLIYARNDSEGRWIYQQMRKASTGYRLRGDIKRHKKPRVVLQEPLD